MRSPHARRSWRRRSSTRHGDRPETGLAAPLERPAHRGGGAVPARLHAARLRHRRAVVRGDRRAGRARDGRGLDRRDAPATGSSAWSCPPGWLPASLFLALVFFQATPLPHALIGLVSPWTTGFYDAALTYTGALDGRPCPCPSPLTPPCARRSKLGAVAAFFLVCYNVYRTRAQVHRALWTMIVMGTLISIFGIVQRVTWNGRFYWIGPEAPHCERVRALREPGALRGAHGDHRAHGAGAVARLAPDSHAEAAHSDLARPAARLELVRGRPRQSGADPRPGNGGRRAGERVPGWPGGARRCADRHGGVQRAAREPA